MCVCVSNAPKDIADLAKSTLILNAECLYMGPPDMNEKILWNIKLDFNWSILRNSIKLSKYSLTNSNGMRMMIDMGKVKNPET